MGVASRIKGVGVYIPERRITNEYVLELLRSKSQGYMEPEELERLIHKAKLQLRKSGNQVRYWCREDEYCTDIARLASEKALSDAGLDPKEIDLIIYTGMSKAFIEPATAHVLRHEIGATKANVIDTQDACTSMMKSIELADSLIKNGNYRTVLIAAGERTYDWADFACKSVEELQWKFASLTIGDGAGALVLERTEEPVYVANPKHMRFFYKIVDGTYATCHIGLNHRLGERYRLCSHSARLIRTGLKAIVELVAEKLQDEEWKGFTYDNLFIHDVGNVIDDLVLPFMREAEVCVPDTYRSFFAEYGNVACASLPLGLWLARKEDRLRPGNLSVFVCPSAGIQAGIMVFVY